MPGGSFLRRLSIQSLKYVQYGCIEQPLVDGVFQLGKHDLRLVAEPRGEAAVEYVVVEISEPRDQPADDDGLRVEQKHDVFQKTPQRAPSVLPDGR